MQQGSQDYIGWSLDTGLKRPINQDSLATVHLQEVSHVTAESIDILALADGMGGHQKGEVASHLAVRAAVRALMDQITRDPNVPENYPQWVISAVKVTNSLVYKTALEHGKNMGTTLVLALVAGHHLHIANVGDSRAYIITKNQIRQITTDHSMFQELVEEGEIDPKDFTHSALKHALTRSIGRAENVVVDTFHEYIPSGSYLLLCSDGLWNEVSEARILQIIQESASVEAASQALVEAANAAGGHDNIAVVLVEIKHSEEE